jgi:hypothetical protein
MMTKTTRVWSLLLAVAALGMVSGLVMAQDKVPAGIAGDYLIDTGTRTLPFTIIVQADKILFDAQIPGGTAAPLTPVEGKALTYKGLDPNGDEMILAFLKDDQGKITGCMVSLPARGMEVKATKVEAK